MADILTPEQRRLNMSRIRGQNTKPEMMVRRGLHGCGLRFRLHVRELPGRPDIVFPRHRAVILVNGCFWHGHGCHLCKPPATRTDFWAAKIAGNVYRDEVNARKLQALEWRILIVWECALRGANRLPLNDLIATAAGFVRNGCAPSLQELPAKPEDKAFAPS